jgi:hypothetical protein
MMYIVETRKGVKLEAGETLMKALMQADAYRHTPRILRILDEDGKLIQGEAVAAKITRAAKAAAAKKAEEDSTAAATAKLQQPPAPGIVLDAGKEAGK